MRLIKLCMAAIVLMGCSVADHRSDLEALMGKTWLLVDISLMSNAQDTTKLASAVSDTPAYKDFSVTFSDDGLLAGQAFNVFSTQVSPKSDGTLVVSPDMVLTRMGVFGQEQVLEQTFLRLISHANAWQISDSQELVLSGQQGSLRFKR